MNKIKKIAQFKCSDGNIFSTEDAAKTHENKLNILKSILIPIKGKERSKHLRKNPYCQLWLESWHDTQESVKKLKGKVWCMNPPQSCWLETVPKATIVYKFIKIYDTINPGWKPHTVYIGVSKSGFDWIKLKKNRKEAENMKLLPCFETLDQISKTK